MQPVRMAATTSVRHGHTRTLAGLAVAAILTLSLGAGTALAAGGQDHRNAENTFTKWITGAGPAPLVASMAGFVGGDVGAGAFTGEVVTLIDLPAPDGRRVIDAVYHFTGSRHSFSADVHVVATGHAPGDTAVLTGRVTEGWLKGNLVEAGYTQITCDHDGINTTCFQGWLDILRGTKPGD